MSRNDKRSGEGLHTRLSAVDFGRVGRECGQFVFVQLGDSRVVLLSGVVGVEIVLSEELALRGEGGAISLFSMENRKRGETNRVGVSSELHVAQLRPCPIGVELGGAHERQMDAQAPVHRRAVEADEYAERDRRPRRALGPAVEADLKRDAEMCRKVT